MTQHADQCIFPNFILKLQRLAWQKKETTLTHNFDTVCWAAFIKDVKVQIQNNFTKSGRYGNLKKKQYFIISTPA